MRKPFEEALADLINEYAGGKDEAEEIMSALELQLMALREESGE